MCIDAPRFLAAWLPKGKQFVHGTAWDGPNLGQEARGTHGAVALGNRRSVLHGGVRGRSNEASMTALLVSLNGPQAQVQRTSI